MEAFFRLVKLGYEKFWYFRFVEIHYIHDDDSLPGDFMLAESTLSKKTRIQTECHLY